MGEQDLFEPIAGVVDFVIAFISNPFVFVVLMILLGFVLIQKARSGS